MSYMQRLLAVLVGLIVVPGLASGSSARVDALRYHFLFADDADVLAYPATAPLYAGLATLDLSTSPVDGSGGLLFGDRSVALGLYLHRPFEYNDVAELDALFQVGDTELPEPPRVHKLADLILATRVGPLGTLGTRAGAGFGLRTEDSWSSDDKMYQSTGAQALVLEVAIGHAWAGDAFSADTALELTGSQFRETAFSDDHERVAEMGSGQLSFVLRERAILKLASPWELGLHVLLTRRGYDLDVSQPDASAGRYARWIGELQLGPRLTLLDRVTVGVGVGARIEHLGGAIDEVAQDSIWGLDLPVARAAVEARLIDALLVRAGIDYRLAYVTTVQLTDKGKAEAMQRATDDRYTWSVGLGYSYLGFGVDATLSSALLVAGPAFIGGGEPGLFTALSVHYAY